MKKILSFILIIILFIIVFLTTIIVTTKNMIKTDNLADYIKEANILNTNISYIMDYDDDVTLKDKISEIALSNGIPQKIVDDLLESDEIISLLGEYFSNLINYTINGEIKPEISLSTIEKIKKVSEESLDNHINIMMPKEELDEKIDQYIKQINTFVFERESVIENIKIIKDFINFKIIYFYIAILLILILLSLLNKIHKAIKYFAIILLTLGIIFVTLGCLDGIIIDFVTNKFNITNKFIPPLITNLLTISFKNGVLISFIGVALIIIYMGINRQKIKQ